MLLIKKAQYFDAARIDAKNLLDRISICGISQKRNKVGSFLKITIDKTRRIWQ